MIARRTQGDEPERMRTCADEPIHIPGCIQPHGALAVFTKSGRLVQKSASLAEVLGAPVPGNPRDLFDLLGGAMGTGHSRGRMHGMLVDIERHQIDGFVVIEIEPTGDVDQSTLFGRLGEATVALSRSATEEEVYDASVQHIQAITGFDRVLAYTLHSDGAGEVVSELRRRTMPAFLGLHFPKSDLPEQARRLYARQASRLIVDVDYEPVPLRPCTIESTGQPLDMSHCRLRSVSPVHLQYLKNMGVRASMSFSIVDGDRLVGLIACHHETPRHVGVDARLVCEIIARHASDHVSGKRDAERRRRRERQRDRKATLLRDVGASAHTQVGSPAWDSAKPFVEADTLVVRLDGEYRTLGESVDAIASLLTVGDRMARLDPDVVSSTNDIAGFEQSGGANGGLLVIPLPGRGWLGWHRAPAPRTVHWAGQPPSDDKPLTPRASFDKWTEVQAGRSLPWDATDVEMAELLRILLVMGLESTGSMPSAMADSIQRLQLYARSLERDNEELTRANEGLQLFANVASHDLRAPLRTVRSFLPLIEAEASHHLSEEARQWMGFVRGATDSLHRLQGSLWSFSRVPAERDIVQIDMNRMVQEVLAGLASDLHGARVDVGDLAPIHAIPGQLEVMLRNLFDNACKYQHADRTLHISLSSTHAPQGVVYSVQDNGIGISQCDAERLFAPFTRLDDAKGEGAGMGLALCRRIAEHHRGWIRAQPVPEGGTRFEFLLRKPACRP